jgi:hypothetical protein
VAQVFISRVPGLSPMEVVLIAAHAADRIVGRKDTESRAAPAASAPFAKIHATLSIQKWHFIWALSQVRALLATARTLLLWQVQPT